MKRWDFVNIGDDCLLPLWLSLLSGVAFEEAGYVCCYIDDAIFTCLSGWQILHTHGVHSIESVVSY